jgi:hypothetical protein
VVILDSDACAFRSKRKKICVAGRSEETHVTVGPRML